jgi:hypothetical protein
MNTSSQRERPQAFVVMDRLAAMPFVETAAAAALAGILYLLDRSISSSLLAFAIGIILSLSRRGFAIVLKEGLRPVEQLCEVVDLDRQVPLPRFHEMLRLYMQIIEPDFALLKSGIVEDAAAQLERLAGQKQSQELATGEYYRWLYEMLNNEPKGGEIWAVSTMNPLEWNESEPERKFVEYNKEAAARGVSISRVFIVDQERCGDLETNPSTAWHFQEAGPIHPYIVVRERLQATDSGLLREIGDGFIAFDQRVAMIDVFTTDGSARGFVTMNPQKLRKLRLNFERLLTHGASPAPATSPQRR